MIARPHQSPILIAWLAATFIVMLLLAWGEKITSKILNNPVLKTEACVTIVDAYLAGSVLVNLLLSMFFGYWWANPVARLVIMFYGFKEGWHAQVESSRM